MRTIASLSHLLLLSLLLIFGGCAGFNRISEPPTNTVANVQIQEIKAMESTFLLELRVLNPNDSPLEIKGLQCDLDIDDRPFARGITNQEISVPSFGSALVPVQVYASMFEMISSVAEIIGNTQQSATRSAPLNYRLSGKVRIDGAGILKTLPFTSEGELSFNKAAATR